MAARRPILGYLPWPSSRSRSVTAGDALWVSSHLSSLSASLAVDVAGKDRARRRQLRTRGDPASAAELGELSFLGRNGEKIKQFRRRRRHEGLRQDGDLPDHLGGDVEDGSLPCRI